MHHEEVKVGDVVNHELEETVGEEVAGLFVGPVADVGVGGKALELPAEAAIDTTGLPPRILRSKENIWRDGRKRRVSSARGNRKSRPKMPKPFLPSGPLKEARRNTNGKCGERITRSQQRCIPLHPSLETPPQVATPEEQSRRGASRDQPERSRDFGPAKKP